MRILQSKHEKEGLLAMMPLAFYGHPCTTGSDEFHDTIEQLESSLQRQCREKCTLMTKLQEGTVDPSMASTKDAEAGTLMSPYSMQNEDLQYSDRFAVGPSLVGALIMSLFCLGILVVRSPLLNFLLKFTGTRY